VGTTWFIAKTIFEFVILEYSVGPSCMRLFSHPYIFIKPADLVHIFISSWMLWPSCLAFLILNTCIQELVGEMKLSDIGKHFWRSTELSWWPQTIAVAEARKLLDRLQLQAQLLVLSKQLKISDDTKHTLYKSTFPVKHTCSWGTYFSSYLV